MTTATNVVNAASEMPRAGTGGVGAGGVGAGGVGAGGVGSPALEGKGTGGLSAGGCDSMAPHRTVPTLCHRRDRTLPAGPPPGCPRRAGPESTSRRRPRRFAILRGGEVSEWLKVPLSKSGVRKHRGFESHPLRHADPDSTAQVAHRPWPRRTARGEVA